MKVRAVVHVKAHDRRIWRTDPMANQESMFGERVQEAEHPIPTRTACQKCVAFKAQIEGLQAQVKRLMENATYPVSRSGDRATSVEAGKWAAKAGQGVTGFRREVLAAFMPGPRTDDGAWRFLEQHKGHEIPKSSVSKRRLDLNRMGYVEDTGKVQVVPTGCKQTVWQITDAGRQIL